MYLVKQHFQHPYVIQTDDLSSCSSFRDGPKPDWLSMALPSALVDSIVNAKDTARVRLLSRYTYGGTHHCRPEGYSPE
jgi:hypothetical protein